MHARTRWARLACSGGALGGGAAPHPPTAQAFLICTCVQPFRRMQLLCPSVLDRVCRCAVVDGLLCFRTGRCSMRLAFFLQHCCVRWLTPESIPCGGCAPVLPEACGCCHTQRMQLLPSHTRTKRPGQVGVWRPAVCCWAFACSSVIGGACLLMGMEWHLCI